MCFYTGTRRRGWWWVLQRRWFSNWSTRWFR